MLTTATTTTTTRAATTTRSAGPHSFAARFFKPSAEPVKAAVPAVAADSDALVIRLAEQASTLGLEAAEVRGALDDTRNAAAAQGKAVLALSGQLLEVMQSQQHIGTEAASGLSAAALVGDAVDAAGTEVTAVVTTLRQVSDAAEQITQIALQTRLVAFNATVEAKRAGESGRGFAVVAEAVKDLATRVESSSKSIKTTVVNLDQRIAVLAREFSRVGIGAAEQAPHSRLHQSLSEVAQAVKRMHQASEMSNGVCAALSARMVDIEGAMRRSTELVDATLARTDAFLTISEQLIESVAEAGVETEDTPYIRAVQEAALEVSQLLDGAVQSRAISLQDLFDDRYTELAGSAPVQHLTRFVPLAEELFPQVQEKVLGLSEKVVFCIAADRNGYIACHNQEYNQPQRKGELVWNTAHCRNRRIFNDRTGLASARNQRPFLLQTYRRDMGGGKFVVLKEVAAPILVSGRHWGGLRLAFKF